MLGSPALGQDVLALDSMLSRGMWQPWEVPHIERQVRAIAESRVAGCSSATSQYWTERLRAELDPRLLLRYDVKQGWVIERWANGCWNICGVLGFQSIRIDLVDYLKAHDMQRWPSPQAYLEWKRSNAAVIRKRNEDAATTKVLAAVDSLSEARIKNFVEVEKAIQTGDTVTMHGETYRQFERMTEAGKKALPGPMSTNPGLHPLRHRRDYSKGEGEQYGQGTADR